MCVICCAKFLKWDRFYKCCLKALRLDVTSCCRRVIDRVNCPMGRGGNGVRLMAVEYDSQSEMEGLIIFVLAAGVPWGN